MANKEIENFLITKLEHGLKVGKNKLPLFESFKRLIDIYKGKLNSSHTPDELLKLRDLLYDLSNTMLECRSLTSTHKRFTTADGFRYIHNTGNELKDKINDNQKSSRPNGTNSLLVSQPENEKYARKSSRAIGEFPIYGFEEHMKAVRPMVLLKSRGDDEFKAIAITGKSGIGKTALAQQIFKEVKSNFSPRIWVCTSKHPNQETDEKTEIVKRILKSLGIEEKVINHVNENYHVKGLIYLLQLNLKGKRFLIVLDDIWSDEISSADSWHGHLGDLFIEGEESFGDKLSHGLPKTKGGTVIVTTTDDDLAEKMAGAKNIYQIFPLSNQEDCWSIFTDEISKDGVNRNTTEKLKKELLQNCAGIPLAAKVMGQILADEKNNQGGQTASQRDVTTEVPIVPEIEEVAS